MKSWTDMETVVEEALETVVSAQAKRRIRAGWDIFQRHHSGQELLIEEQGDPQSGIYKVRSTTKSPSYQVNINEGHFSCECPNWVKSKEVCKHFYAARLQRRYLYVGDDIITTQRRMLAEAVNYARAVDASLGSDVSIQGYIAYHVLAPNGVTPEDARFLVEDFMPELAALGYDTVAGLNGLPFQHITMPPSHVSKEPIDPTFNYPLQPWNAVPSPAPVPNIIIPPVPMPTVPSYPEDEQDLKNRLFLISDVIRKNQIWYALAAIEGARDFQRQHARNFSIAVTPEGVMVSSPSWNVREKLFRDVQDLLKSFHAPTLYTGLGAMLDEAGTRTLDIAPFYLVESIGFLGM